MRVAHCAPTHTQRSIDVHTFWQEPYQVQRQSEEFQEIREAMRALCAGFPDQYFRQIDEQRGYPEALVTALIKAGWLAAMIPEEYGGAGLGLSAASVVMEEINRCGGNFGAVRGQIYNMGTLVRNGSAAQKEKYLPRIASGDLRMQSMGVTEPATGSDTTKIKTTAVKKSRPIHYQWPEGLDLPGTAFRFDDSPCAHDARECRSLSKIRMSLANVPANRCRCWARLRDTATAFKVFSNQRSRSWPDTM
jgi:Acyl-CoA dehydrogenase, N-terminal domain